MNKGYQPDASDVLYARQPIYDRALNTVGFELLFRPSPEEPIPPSENGTVFDGDNATNEVMLRAFSDSDIDLVCEQQPAFINFTADTLQKALPFNPKRIVIEVLESVTETETVLSSIQKQRDDGYRIALDDYRRTDDLHPLIALADIVKLEYPAYTGDELRKTVKVLRRHGVQVLAEKIETQEQFEDCVEAGCDLFQGFFLSRPTSITGKTMPQSRLSVLQLLQALNDPDTSLHQLANVVSQDVFLSVRMLKLVNSASYRRAREIDSIQMAVVMLGMERIRALANMLALSRLEDKPHALQRIAVNRANLTGRIYTRLAPSGFDTGYTAGLFSCLDAFFDQPLNEILAHIPLTNALADALLKRQGALGLALQSAIDFEQGRWSNIDWDNLQKQGIQPSDLAFDMHCALQSSEETPSSLD